MQNHETNMYVVLQADDSHDVAGCRLFLRLSLNGNRQQDFMAEKVAGLEDTYIVKTYVPCGMNMMVIQMGKISSNNTKQVAANSHIVDIDRNTLLHIQWGKQLHKLVLGPGKQLIFILQAPGRDAVTIQGSIRQPDSCHSDDLIGQSSLQIPKTGSLIVVPVRRGGESVEFRMLHHGAEGMEWEEQSYKNTPAKSVGNRPLNLPTNRPLNLPTNQLIHQPIKSAKLSSSHAKTDVLVSRWNDPVVHKTEVSTSWRGQTLQQPDDNMVAILGDAADTYNSINSCVLTLEI